MARYIHQLVAYGLGACAFVTLGMATDQAAAELPFVSRIHSIPPPAQTYVFDQRTEGGKPIVEGSYCPTRTQLVVRSEQPLDALRAYYEVHTVPAAHSERVVVPTVHRAQDLSDLDPDWARYRKDPTVYVVEYLSPGAPESEENCPPMK